MWQQLSGYADKAPEQGKSQLTLNQVRPVESNVTRVTLDVQIDWATALVISCCSTLTARFTT